MQGPRTVGFLVAAICAVAGCKAKHEPTPLGPWEFCITLSDCAPGNTCFQNLCIDPATIAVEGCAIDVPSCPTLPQGPIDLLDGVDVREGAAALHGSTLLVSRAILGVELFGYLFDLTTPSSPNVTLDETELVGVHAEPDRPRIVCTGFGWGIVWTDTTLGARSVWFGRLAPDASRITEDVLVARRGREADLAWDGDEFGVVWTSPVGEREAGVWFTTLDGVGFPLLDEPVKIADRMGEGTAYPAIASDGAGRYGVAWNDGDRVRFATVGSNGIVVFNDQVGTGASGARAVQIVWNGAGWGLMWRDADGPTLLSLDSDGLTASSARSVGAFVGNVDEHRLLWAGDRYWGAWADPTQSPGSVLVTAVDLTAMVLDNVMLNGAGVEASVPYFFAAGSVAGVLFSVTRRPGESAPDDLVYATASCQ